MKKLTILISLISFSMVIAYAQTQKTDKKTEPTATTMTKEQREKMATHHESMAACLRSDKDMKECHNQMRESCKSMGPESCQMMGDGMGHGGHMMKHKKK